MKNCDLIKQFAENKRKYIVYKHQYTQKSNKEREQKIIKFLKFACLAGIKRITDINKAIFDDFMKSISNKSLETKRKYRLALAEFAQRANLSFKVVKDVNRQKEKKFYNIKKFLLEKYSVDIDKHKDEILKIL